MACTTSDYDNSLQVFCSLLLFGWSVIHCAIENGELRTSFAMSMKPKALKEFVDVESRNLLGFNDNAPAMLLLLAFSVFLSPN